MCHVRMKKHEIWEQGWSMQAYNHHGALWVKVPKRSYIYTSPKSDDHDAEAMVASIFSIKCPNDSS